MWNVCRGIYRVLVLCKMQKAPFCSNRKGLIWLNIKLPLSLERNGRSLRVEAVMQFSARRPTRLSLPSSCGRLRSAPPWFWEVKMGRRRQRDDGLPQILPEGSRTADGKSRTQWGRRGSRESVGRSSQPEGRRCQLEESSIMLWWIKGHFTDFTSHQFHSSLGKIFQELC